MKTVMTLNEQLKQAKTDLNYLVVRGDENLIAKKREEIRNLEHTILHNDLRGLRPWKG